MQLNPDQCWQAVCARDASFDGVFYFAVRTTGVYCRPSCAARQPLRQNVSFYPLPNAARQAGFRACKRCKPDQTALRNPQAELIHRACRLLEADADAQLTLETLGAQLRVSPYHLQRLFKKLMGITPREYAEARRAAHFKQAVQAGANVTTALYEAGYGSSSRLYEHAAARLGMTPATYRKGGKGMEISYTIAGSPLGWLLVAATGKGICSVALGDEAEQLAADLRAEFPQAALTRDETNLLSHVAALVAHLRGELPHPDLPLDVRGTAFQQRVWAELRRIPYGTTISYRALAERIGQPTAARAVARACATNPVALVTPCHRVVREKGEVSGYRWGVARKQALLKREKGE